MNSHFSVDEYYIIITIYLYTMIAFVLQWLLSP